MHNGPPTKQSPEEVIAAWESAHQTYHPHDTSIRPLRGDAKGTRYDPLNMYVPGQRMVTTDQTRLLRHLVSVRRNKKPIIGMHPDGLVDWLAWATPAERNLDLDLPALVDAIDIYETEMTIHVGMDGETSVHSAVREALRRWTGDDSPCTWAAIIHMLLAVAWRNGKYPTVMLDADNAANLVTTRTHPSLFADMIVPWDTFMVSLPRETFYGETMTGTSELRWLYVHSEVITAEWLAGCPEALRGNVRLGERRWWFTAYGYGFANLCGTCLSDEQLVAEPKMDGGAYDTDVNRNNLMLLGRLIHGVCFEFSQHRLTATKPKRPKDMNAIRWAKKLRALNTHVFLPAVSRSDLLDDIRAFTRGQADHVVTVRTIVCRHRKWQHYGPKNSLRKIIVVEPYERGPKGAPTGVRAHGDVGKQAPLPDENLLRKFRRLHRKLQLCRT